MYGPYDIDQFHLSLVSDIFRNEMHYFSEQMFSSREDKSTVRVLAFKEIQRNSNWGKRMNQIYATHVLHIQHVQWEKTMKGRKIYKAL